MAGLLAGSVRSGQLVPVKSKKREREKSEREEGEKSTQKLVRRERPVVTRYNQVKKRRESILKLFNLCICDCATAVAASKSRERMYNRLEKWRYIWGGELTLKNDLCVSQWERGIKSFECARLNPYKVNA